MFIPPPFPSKSFPLLQIPLWETVGYTLSTCTKYLSIYVEKNKKVKGEKSSRLKEYPSLSSPRFLQGEDFNINSISQLYLNPYGIKYENLNHPGTHLFRNTFILISYWTSTRFSTWSERNVFLLRLLFSNNTKKHNFQCAPF